MSSLLLKIVPCTHCQGQKAITMAKTKGEGNII